MSQRRSSGGGAAAASAAASSSSPITVDEDVEMKEADRPNAPGPASAANVAGPASADANRFNLAQIMSSCHFPGLPVLTKRLVSELKSQIHDMAQTIEPLKDVACAYVKRRGKDWEASSDGQAKIEQWITKIRICIQKQHELGLLIKLLQMIETDSGSNSIEAGRDWSDWLREVGTELEARIENRKRLADEEKKVIDEFKARLYKIHRLPLAGQEEEVVEADENTENAVTCKLTQRLLEEPVKNAACQHRYSKSAILEYLLTKQKGTDPRTSATSQPPKLRSNYACVCPVHGCRVQVSVSTLEVDRAAEKEVAAFIKLQERAKKHAAVGGAAAAAAVRGGGAISAERGGSGSGAHRKHGTIKEEDLTQVDEFSAAEVGGAAPAEVDPVVDMEDDGQSTIAHSVVTAMSKRAGRK